MFDELLHKIKVSQAEHLVPAKIGPGLRMTAVQCVQDI